MLLSAPPGSIGPAASDPMGPRSFTGHITIGLILLPALPEYTELAASDLTARSFADDTNQVACRAEGATSEAVAEVRFQALTCRYFDDRGMRWNALTGPCQRERAT